MRARSLSILFLFFTTISTQSLFITKAQAQIEKSDLSSILCRKDSDQETKAIIDLEREQVLQKLLIQSLVKSPDHAEVTRFQNRYDQHQLRVSVTHENPIHLSEKNPLSFQKIPVPQVKKAQSLLTLEIQQSKEEVEAKKAWDKRNDDLIAHRKKLAALNPYDTDSDSDSD